MRSVFFGSPEFAVAGLEALRATSDLVAVVSQPDRPAGRGQKQKACAVCARATALGISVLTPPSLKNPPFAPTLAQLSPDVAVVIAYGKILPKDVLDVPRFGCVNIHGSVLPAWRGAAPIARAIQHGDARTGVTLMKMDEGMDTGPILAVRETEIGPEETAGELTARLARLGAALLAAELPRYLRGEIAAVPQAALADPTRALAPKLSKEEGWIDWSRPAAEVAWHVRSMNPWPSAWTRCNGRRLQVHRVRVEPGDGTPGAVLGVDREGARVACGQGAVLLTELQLEGKKRMDGARFAAGSRLSAGARLGV